MRLTDSQRDVIRKLARRHFGVRAEVRVFGSRIDDRARGGDLDLFIETELSGNALQDAELAFLRELQDEMGEQRVDVTLHTRGEAMTGFEAYARREGIPL